MIKKQPKKTYRIKDSAKHPIKHRASLARRDKPDIPTTKPSIPFKIILEDRVINRDGSVTFFKK